MRNTSEAKKFWNERYAKKSFIYGREPNTFFKGQIDSLKPGKLLLPAEGEGRNAVYAARNGWQVDAFDLSEDGRQKALSLADKYGATIDYRIADFQGVQINPEQYNALALIYAHMDESIRRKTHRKLAGSLKPGGTLILEAFSKQQLGNDSGGPQNKRMLYNMDELKKDFEGFNFSMIKQGNHKISEGKHHRGKANIIRLVAGKKS